MSGQNRIIKVCRWVAVVTAVLLITCVGTGGKLPAATVSFPPVIFKVSDGVAPGRSFSINGQWFDPASVKLAMLFDTTGQFPDNPPTNAFSPTICQTDKDAHFVIARLPAGKSAGVYDVWVGNNNSWSSCAKMNAARALFMSDYQAFNGIDIEIIGRNFDQSEFGLPTRTQVRLNDGIQTTNTVPVKDVNPYHVTFTVGNQPLGNYYVEVSSDNGMNWSRLASGQKLTVLAKPSGTYDPLGLGVSWAADFNWTNIYNVTNYGVVPYNPNDQTLAIQEVENLVEQQGGVLYFPAGTYCFGTNDLYIGANVVIEGQSANDTFLLFDGAGHQWLESKGNNCIGGVAQLQGVANIGIGLASPNDLNARPDTFINLGDTTLPYSNDDIDRTANRIFLSGVYLSYPYTQGGSTSAGARRGIAHGFTGEERFLVKDCNFSGWYAGTAGAHVANYCIYQNNRIECSCGWGIQASANYCFVENNYIKYHPEYDQLGHGIAVRRQVYVANNTIIGPDDLANLQNGGEAVYVEDASLDTNLDYGTVTAATTNTVTVNPIRPLYDGNNYLYTLANGDLNPDKGICLLITCGTGLGQLLPVKTIDSISNVITLNGSFKVLPDTTSKFTIYISLACYTVYSNLVVDSTKGLWGYKKTYDTVMANNTCIDSDGIFFQATRTGPTNSIVANDQPDYFSRITKNKIIGVSRRSHQAGIGFFTHRGDTSKFFDILAYNFEVHDNQIYGNNTLKPGPGTETPDYDGIYMVSALLGTLSDGTGTGDGTDTLIESNQFSNLPLGIVITPCNYGTLINGNTYDASVLKFLNNWSTNTDNTLITSNVQLTSSALPAIAAQPQSQFIPENGMPTYYVLATGTPAPYYQWYLNNQPIIGANGASYTPYTMSTTNLGSSGAQFYVELSNGAGSMVSSNAWMLISSLFLTPPSNLRVTGSP